MKKQSKRKVRATAAPMLVLRGVVNDTLETQERMSVEAFAFGFANEMHYNALADMQGAMLLAATAQPSTMPIAVYARDVVGPVLKSIVKRYQATGKFGCSGEELKILRAFVSKHRDFWLRQPVGLYVAAYAKMKEVQEETRKKANHDTELLRSNAWEGPGNQKTDEGQGGS